MTTTADPFPVGTWATVVDYDPETILGPFQVVRSYWPKPVVELLADPGTDRQRMVRQNHDRMRSTP